MYSNGTSTECVLAVPSRNDKAGGKNRCIRGDRLHYLSGPRCYLNRRVKVDSQWSGGGRGYPAISVLMQLSRKRTYSEQVSISTSFTSTEVCGKASRQSSAPKTPWRSQCNDSRIPNILPIGFHARKITTATATFPEHRDGL